MTFRNWLREAVKTMLHGLRHDWQIWMPADTLIGMQERRCRYCNLREARPLVAPHIHKWGQWNNPSDITAEGRVVGFSQVRTCQDCGYMQLDTQTIYSGIVDRAKRAGGA